MYLMPSMMCADMRNLQQEVRSLDEAGADSFHCDVMDGAFVANFGMGLGDLSAIRQSTDKTIDVHLMINDPLDKLQCFIDAGADAICIHPESGYCASKALTIIRSAGLKAGLAISPDVSIGSVEEILPYADYVIAMTVYPGFAGQAFVESTLGKVKKLAELKATYHYVLVADGACSDERIGRLSKLGVDGFVLGTSALFGKGEDYAERFKAIRG